MSASPNNTGLELITEVAPPDPSAAPRTAPQPTTLGHEALQALLAFSSLHEQIRQRREQEMRRGTQVNAGDVWQLEQFVLDEVLQLVAERALAITGADGVAIALAEGNAIVCRASSGRIAPDVGARLDPDSGFSGTCLVSGRIVRCDDSEIDPRVDVLACRRLGVRSMVAVPLSAKQTIIGLLEAFSSEAYGFNDSDVRSLNLLAELILSAMRPEEEDRLAEISQRVVGRAAAPAIESEVTGTETGLYVQAPDLYSQLERLEANASPGEAAHEPDRAKSETLFEMESETAASANSSRAEAEFISLERGNVGDNRLSHYAGGPPESAPEEHRDSSPGLQRGEKREARQSRAGTAEILTATLSSGEMEEDAVSLVRRIGLSAEPAPLSGCEAVESSRPGLAIVIGLVLFAIGLGTGLWWNIRHNTHSVSSKPQLTALASTQQAPNKSAPPVVSQQPVAEDETSSVPATPDEAASQEAGVLPQVTGIRHWSSGDSSTVVIDLQDQVQYEAHRLTNPERIYFDLHDTRLVAELSGKRIEVGDTLLQQIRVAQPMAGVTRVVLVTRNASNFSVSLEPNPYRLVVEVSKLGAKPHDRAKIDLFAPMNEQTPPQQAQTTQNEQKPMAASAQPAGAAERQVRARAPTLRIALDPGHGGWDLGTVGRAGLLEKDLALDIVERLGNLLKNRLGAEVIYTRADDNYVALEKRAEIANLSHADLFMSVHANYSDFPSARGVETYYTNTYSSVKARPRETDETAPMLQTINWTNVDIREKVHESRRFASSVQRALYGTLVAKTPGLPNRGVKEAQYVVLTGTSMPAILAEVSFVSSPTDENNLQSSTYRQQIAEALYQGVARYAKESNRVKMASNLRKAAGR